MTVDTIKAKVIIRVQGISGPWEQIISKNILDAPNIPKAKEFFEKYVWMEHQHMMPQSIKFEYIEISEGIKWKV